MIGSINHTHAVEKTHGKRREEKHCEISKWERQENEWYDSLPSSELVHERFHKAHEDRTLFNRDD